MPLHFMTFTYTRWFSTGLALLAACALVAATQILPWWALPETSVYLTRSERCFGGGACDATGLAWLGASDWWVRLTSATYGLGLFGALLALFVAGARAAGRVPTTAAKSLLVNTVVALGCAIGTWLMFPRISPPAWAWGAPMYMLGLVISAVIAITTRPPGERTSP